MREQIRHDMAAGPTVEVDLGTVLTQAADAIEEHVAESARADITLALEMRHHPSALDLAQLTDRLLTHCATAADGVHQIPAATRSVRGAAALKTWQELKEAGPADGPLGPWSYARHLALVARDMVQEIDGHRVTRASFVGRPGLAPPAPDAP